MTTTPHVSTTGAALRKFVQSIRHILSVPKQELAKSEAAYQQERAAKKASRISKVSVLLLLALCCLPIQSAFASPEERAQMCKALVLRRLLADGWQLVQETQSLLVVERPMTGVAAFMVQGFTTGPHGTNPVVRWSITLIPESDRYTQVYANGTFNSQNAFGQTTSIKMRNKKDIAYIYGVIKAASASLPARYKFKDK